MKYLILVCPLIILCVSCASSRQEFSTQQSSAVTSVRMQSGSDYMEELLSKLVAKYSDSVHMVMESYYPPKSDSDSVGPLKAKVTLQRKSEAGIMKTEHKDIQAKDSTDIQQNDSTSNEKKVEVQKESSAFKFTVIHLFVCCLIFIIIYGCFKRFFNC